MKKPLIVIATVLFSLPVFAQQTQYYSDPATTFREAREYFQKEQYSLAYPLFRELQQSVRETDKVNLPVTVQEINYYSTVCGLKQNESAAEFEALQYIDNEKNAARIDMLQFHLAEYYFRQQQFKDALEHYEQASIDNLSNRELADLNFHKGYCYFVQQNFAAAKPLFNTIRQVKDDPNYTDANYYYGFLSFRDRQYNEALSSFKIVENDKNYATVVPYYIAQIYYIQGKKEESIAYIQGKLNSGSNSQYYDLELKQLIGHAYFEKKEYAKALPYLESYVDRSSKVRREDLYELSYCYYQANQLNKAIDGFKQLSGRDDSLSQHAMYLLGDAYLRTGNKANARNAFLFCSTNSSNASQKEISQYQYAKLSYELGYQDEALKGLKEFIGNYPNSQYNAEARELLVGALANTNNFNDAQVLLESMDKPTPATQRLYPRILYGRATELINDGRLAEANSLLDRAIKDPNNATVLPYLNFWKGELAYRANKLDDAIKYYNAFVSASPAPNGDASMTNAKYNLGYCYLRKENYPVAQTFFEPLAKNPALNTGSFEQDAYLRTADCYYMQKSYATAKTMYDNVIKLSWPAEDYATFQLAMLAGVKSSTEKINGMNTMIRKFPNSPLVMDANMEIANTYMGNEKFREALPYLGNVVKANGNDSYKPEAILKMGTAYYNIDDNADALKQYKSLVEQYPNSPEADDALDEIKNIYIETGKAGEYADFMRNAGRPLSMDTEDSLTFTAADNQMDNGKADAALAGYQDYLQRFPNGVYALDAQFNSAEIYSAQKKTDEALSGYAYVAAKAPNKYAERATLGAARISYFDKKDYAGAEKYYAQLKQITASQENKLEAMRGLLRSQYQLQKWSEASDNAKELTAAKGSSADDKTMANMVIAKSYETGGQYDQAIQAFKSVIQLNKAAMAAEARYETANCYFQLNKLGDAEKTAFETINKSGSYDFWVTKAYILLGDIYFKQKDYFNAKATYQSIVDNSLDPQLKGEAQTKLDKVTDEESRSSKVNGN